MIAPMMIRREPLLIEVEGVEEAKGLGEGDGEDNGEDD